MPVRIVLRVLAYLLAAWGTLVALAFGWFPGSAVLAIAIAIYFTAPLFAFLLWRGWPFYPNAAFRLLIVRPFWYAQLLLPLVAAGGLVGLLGGWPFGHALTTGRIVAGVVLVAVSGILLAGYFGSRRLVVREVEVVVADLADAFDGLRIAQLSDLHVGPHTPRRFLARVLEATRRTAPDLIAVTGDLIDDRAEDVAVYARTLGELDAPLGVFVIPGNHDVYAGWEEVEHALRNSDVGTVLVNDVALVSRDGETLALLGTGDPAGGRLGSSRAAPDIDRAMARVPSDTTVIALAHNPALWPSLARHGVALTLSGHTHWGQFAFPGRGWSLASLFLEHAMGAHVDNDSALYISPGTGYWGIPFRLGASPEVTAVTLRRGSVTAARVHPPRAA
jgi:predicted MPP superfamily phosphohydrolase